VSHLLSRVPFLGQFVDERFLSHRLRASSFAGIAVALLALVIFEYRLIRYGRWDWDLALIAVVFVVLKMAAFLWFRTRD
jgi:hypothetical protein